MMEDLDPNDAYPGSWDELDSVRRQPNVIAEIPTPLGVFVTFKVHGAEGTRTYFYPRPVINTVLKTVEEFFG